MSVVLYGETTVSIHAPARGATIGKYLYPQLVQVSIHAPARGATGVTVSSFTPLLFQFTLPRGERHEINRQLASPWMFQFTLPRGERRGVAIDGAQSINVSIHAPARGATVAMSVAG